MSQAISDVHVRLYDGARGLRAFIDFAVYGTFRVCGIKVVELDDGTLRVIWPDRPKRGRCGHCGLGVDITASFCGHCGERQPVATRPSRARRGAPGCPFRQSFRPIDAGDRARIEAMLLRAFRLEQAKRQGVEPLRVHTGGAA